LCESSGGAGGVACQGCIKLPPARSRSADFQSAVSQVSNLQTLKHAGRLGFSTPFRLISLLACVIVGCLTGCGQKKETTPQRAEAAHHLFDQATKEFHLPSDRAAGAEKARLQQQAADAYQRLVREFPDQPFWAAQALRNLGNIRAAQTNLDEAVRLFSAVGDKYPQEEFEVLQAWRTAGDLLWEANRRPEAKAFYQKVVQRFDGTNQPAVVRLVVKGAKTRLGGVPGSQ
jgi:tetratricopeptide (TPR) repeat protein